MLQNWTELFKVLNGDKREPDSDEKAGSDLKIDERIKKRYKRVNDKSSKNQNESGAKRVKTEQNDASKLKDNELKTFFEILKCVAIFEDALSNKIKDEANIHFSKFLNFMAKF